MKRTTWSLAIAGLTLAAPAIAGDADPKLASQAYGLLKEYCHRCHGIKFEVPGYDVLDYDKLLAKRGEGEKPYVTPGKPEESELWQQVGVDKEMPPSSPKPTDAQREAIAAWIKAGAPRWTVEASARPIRTEKDVIRAVRDHLRKADEADRPYLRYVSLHNLNDNRSVLDADLRQARAAVAKLANSLSWKPKIVVPRAVDPDQLVLALDTRDLGWDERDAWNEMLGHYPYGLRLKADAESRDLCAEAELLSGTPLPYIRADWFVAVASRPPIYHAVLDLPKQSGELARTLKVDVEGDFLRDRLARAGFAESGVSNNNRVVDRHDALYGAYWESYDFRRNEGAGNIFQKPLGPAFEANPFPRLAFEHAGGEIIFHLPNGLQGYLLVDGKGNRIDAGPPDVVSDSLKTSGTAEVINGLSCMACHQDGMRRFKDTLRDGLAVGGEARSKAERLVPEPKAMGALLDEDEARFLRALDAAAGPFLKAGDDSKKSIRDFPEPIGVAARNYVKDMTAADAAADLGLKGPDDLLAAIRANPALRNLGLAPFLRDGKIKRAQWDSLEGRFLSTFHEAARQLEVGVPSRVLGAGH